MCKKVNNKKTSNTRIDRCIQPLIKWLKNHHYITRASCCGHNKYPLTVVVRLRAPKGFFYIELFSGIEIPRKRNFYKRDKEGYYYIPEVVDNEARWNNKERQHAEQGIDATRS